MSTGEAAGERIGGAMGLPQAPFVAAADRGAGGRPEGIVRLSPERVAVAREIIARYPGARSALIPLVHLAEEQDGYVAGDAMEHIAELLGCTPAEVYGTATFYEMFKFHPVGKYVIGVCTNISCLLLGGDELLEHA